MKPRSRKAPERLGDNDGEQPHKRVPGVYNATLSEYHVGPPKTVKESSSARNQYHRYRCQCPSRAALEAVQMGRGTPRSHSGGEAGGGGDNPKRVSC